MIQLSFSRLMRHGRYGNSKFQIASLLGLADKLGAQAVFPAYKYDEYLLNPIPHGEMQTKVIEETNCFYQEWDITESCDILGYLQHYKYFEHIKDKIKEQFTYKPEFVEKIKNKLPVKDKEFVLLQIRRDDYIQNSNYWNAPMTYYIDSIITHFPNINDYQFIVCSDDIPYCRVHFECLPHVFFTDKWSDVEQMCLYNFVDHFIIANSSFGWWQSYLGEKPHSKVIHPGHHLRGKLLEQNGEATYWLPNWIRNQKDNYRVDLKDLTVTIPVFHDSLDRKKNLDLSVCLLQKDFDTNIIVCEQGGNKFEYMSQYCTYIKEESKLFHRTKMLNDMALMAETPIIANWDCDVIVPPMQVYLTVKAIREGADMVFPYDGRFARMPRQWFPKIEKLLDIGIVGDTKFLGKRGKALDPDSVGGAVFFNKDSFIEGGMENEYMISFAPEDVERDYRFRKLGYKVLKMGGCLYHLDHHVGINSSPSQPLYKANKAELHKEQAMSKDELIEYINSWPWVHIYTEKYYKDISPASISSAKEVFKILTELGVKHETVIDVGCGVGEWNNNNPGYQGIDYKIPKKRLLIPESNYSEIDLTKVPEIDMEDLKYDLCLCVEVAEHLPEEKAKPLVNFLCGLSNQVLFSAAIPFQGGTGHENEKWQSYWANIFAENNYYPSDLNDFLRTMMYDNSAIELYYKQNIVLYEKNGKGVVTDFVHPQYYIQIVKNLKAQIVNQNK